MYAQNVPLVALQPVPHPSNAHHHPPGEAIASGNPLMTGRVNDDVMPRYVDEKLILSSDA